MVTDQEVIARASGGLALCGTHVGTSDEHLGRVRASKQLLRSPEQCQLLISDQVYKLLSHSCSNIEASESFREEVKNSGWTVAINLHANVCGFGVEALGEGGRHQDKQTSQSSLEMTKEACHMQVWYYPKASFAIPLHQMQLSEEALNDARRVRSPADADKFLLDYNSHVSTGKYQVGGVLMKGLVMRTSTTRSLQQMLEKVSTNAGAGINFERFKVGGKVDFANADDSSSTKQRASNQATVDYVYTALGPRTDEEGDFKTQLDKKSTWDIIDIVDGPDLVPVWEIPAVRNAKALQNCCALLRKAWQDSVKTIADENPGRIYSLLQASSMENVKSLLEFSSPCPDLKILRDTLNRVWLEMTVSLDPSSKKELFELDKFHDLLRRLAESKETDLLDGRGLLRDFLRDERVWLEEQGIHLSSSVQALLERNEVEPVVPLPPSEDMSPGGLVAVEHVVAGPVTPKGSRSRDILDDDIPSSVKTENLDSDILGRSSHLLDLERSNKALAVGSIPEGISIIYNRHMLVDRRKDISDDPRRLMMDRIRHRLQPFASTSSNPADVSRRKHYFARASRVNKGMSGNGIAKSHSTRSSSPLGTLVQLLTSSDLLARTALFQLLLDARIAIPLVIPSRTKENSSFGHLAEALDFVRVKLVKQEILSIAEDTKLPRVVFLSNRKSSSKRETSYMASKVMNFQLPSTFKGDTDDGITVIELGVGFLRTSEDESQDHKPCLVFCVWGDHNRLGEFLAKVADFIIVERDPSEDANSPSWITGKCKDHIIYWKINPSEQDLVNEPRSTVWGSFQQIADDIEGYLFDSIVVEKSFKGASEGGAATLKQCLTSIPTFNKETTIFNPANLDKIQLEKAKESLKLQKNYAKEADIYFESLRRRHSKPEYFLQRVDLQNQRKKLASAIQKLPLLQTFISILSLRNYVERNIGIVKLELSIEKKLHLILKRAYAKEARAFEESQRDEDNLQLKDNYNVARQEHVNKKLGLEHLWRELSHMFVADIRLKHLPQLAAEHLIDGFPLEILDGDAGMFNGVWVGSILDELNRMLSASLKHKPKVFVLSVIGLQSSGKSTMLNVMFGTKLKTSAGQCTRGVYLQLIKSERKEFDYVLILDTEGIRSPEFFGEKNAEVHDNRLATFAVLPADACIVMVANEDDNGLKEVLPMVMLAFKESAMAEQCDPERRQAKVCFAYRSVDTNDISKLERNQRKLQETLRSASKVSIGVRKESSPGVDTLLKDFRISTKPEEESDVKYFGNLKKGNVPPGDTPDWAYGANVERLREYIHQRVTDDGWKASELKSWIAHLKLVWDCIADANFEISFRNRTQYVQFYALQDELGSCRQKVGKKWMEQFEKMAGDLQVERGTVPGLDPSFQPLWNKLGCTVQKTVDETTEEVKAILEQPHRQEWQVDELVNWNKFCSDQERDLQQRLQDCIDGVIKFDNVLRDYIAKIQMEIDAKTRDIDMTSANREENMKREFNEIFQRILRQAREGYPPNAETVSTKVTKVYHDGQITGKRFDFHEEEPRLDFHAEESNASNAQKKTGTSWDLSKLNLLKLLRMRWDSTEGKHSTARGSTTQQVITALDSEVEAYLQDKKQYADHIIDKMIRSTEKSTTMLVKGEQYRVHLHVKQLLTQKLVAIQEKWDEDHNVSKRLEKEEKRLWLFFQDRADRVDGTKLLFTQIDDLLKTKVMDSFRGNLSNHVTNKLINDGWAGNWIVMRAHLDLHLVGLIETSDTKELLRYVRNGAIHYKTVVDNLIRQEILSQVKDGHLWVSFLENIKSAFKIAAINANMTESASSKFPVFVKYLVQSINNNIGPGSLQLTRDIATYVSKDVYSKYGGVLDFFKLSRQVRRGLDTDIKPDLTSSSIDEVVNLVTERMIQCSTDNAGPRCAEECPHCKLTCFRRLGHPGHHDTLHQPSGLGGRRYIKSLELVPRSCSESVIADDKFLNVTAGINELVPYKDWNMHYTEWKVPTTGNIGTVHVREYIFAHYQEDIAKVYSTEDDPVKICSRIPPEFLLHEIGALRCHLESTVACT